MLDGYRNSTLSKASAILDQHTHCSFSDHFLLYSFRSLSSPTPWASSLPFALEMNQHGLLEECQHCFFLAAFECALGCQSFLRCSCSAHQLSETPVTGRILEKRQTQQRRKCTIYMTEKGEIRRSVGKLCKLILPLTHTHIYIYIYIYTFDLTLASSMVVMDAPKLSRPRTARSRSRAVKRTGKLFTDSFGRINFSSMPTYKERGGRTWGRY